MTFISQEVCLFCHKYLFDCKCEKCMITDCPYCDGEVVALSDIKIFKGVEIYEYYYKCNKCKEEFTDTNLDTLTVDQLQRIR